MAGLVLRKILRSLGERLRPRKADDHSQQLSNTDVPAGTSFLSVPASAPKGGYVPEKLPSPAARPRTVMFALRNHFVALICVVRTRPLTSCPLFSKNSIRAPRPCRCKTCTIFLHPCYPRSQMPKYSRHGKDSVSDRFRPTDFTVANPVNPY